MEGSWSNPGGFAVSTFKDGIMYTMTADGKARLAEGTYRAEGPDVGIAMRSLVRRKTVNVQCEAAGPNRLNCHASDGKDFTLNRIVG